MSEKKINVYYLKLEDQRSIPYQETEGYTITPIAKPICVDDYLKIYNRIGEGHQWNDRLELEKSDLEQTINEEKSLLFHLMYKGEEVGYSELVLEGDYVELLYFGLYPEAVTHGHGTHFLQIMINKAWSYKPQWVQLNTCDLDHPAALKIYQRQGFKITDIKTK